MKSSSPLNRPSVIAKGRSSSHKPAAQEMTITVMDSSFPSSQSSGVRPNSAHISSLRARFFMAIRCVCLDIKTRLSGEIDAGKHDDDGIHQCAESTGENLAGLGQKLGSVIRCFSGGGSACSISTRPQLWPLRYCSKVSMAREMVFTNCSNWAAI